MGEPSRAQGEDRSGTAADTEDRRGQRAPSPHSRSACSEDAASSLGTNAASEDDDEEEEEEEEEEEARAPDGGWGWIVVGAAFMTNLIADGVTFTFGIIYVDLLKYFKEGKSKTAWIGGLFMAMPLLSGPVASCLTERFGCRRVCIFGAVLSAVGFIVSSFARSLELLVFTFGVVSGFGLALCYVAAVVIVAFYFDKRRSLATGLSVCGSGIGTFVFAPLTASLITEYGWRGTTLILAGLFLNIAVCGALMRDLKWTRAKSRALRRDRKRRGRHGGTPVAGGGGCDSTGGGGGGGGGASQRSADSPVAAAPLPPSPPSPRLPFAQQRLPRRLPPLTPLPPHPPLVAAAAAASPRERPSTPLQSVKEIPTTPPPLLRSLTATRPPQLPPLHRGLRRLLPRGGTTDQHTSEHTGHLKEVANTNSSSIHLQNDDTNRHFSSVLNIPTYVCNGEKVPLEVLELLSTNKREYRVHLKKFTSPRNSRSTSLQDNTIAMNQIHSSREAPAPKLKKNAWPPLVVIPHPSVQQNPSTLYNSELEKLNEQTSRDEGFQWWTKKPNEHKHTTEYLKDLQVHRHSLIYRSAVLKIRRHRLRASSCPDIYRNSMTQTVQEKKDGWFSCLWDLKDVVAEMVDFTHFTDVRFVLFAISNFILYSWYDVPYVFITDKAIEMGFSEPDASFLISILGILNMLGVIILGWAGDQSWVNAGVVYAICMAICGVVTGLVPLLSSYTGLCIVAGGFGLSISANYSLASIILVELITLDRFANAYGLLLLVQGIANLIGPPLAGWLYDISGAYDLSFYLAGFFIILCGILLIVLPAMEWINICWNGQKQFRNRSNTSVTIHLSQNMFCIKGKNINCLEENHSAKPENHI